MWMLARLVKEHTSNDTIIDELPRIFEPVAWHGDKPIRWALSPDVSLSWYISMLPCGEASSSALRHQYSQKNGCERAVSMASGIVRGRNLPHASTSCLLRTKPGRADAAPSISMSCSDKLMLWNAVGIQGALLSQWLEPVHICRIITSWSPELYHGLSEKACVESCMWAVCGRIPERAYNVSVECTHVTFAHSRDCVEQYISKSTGISPESSAWKDVEPVPCAASLLWIRGHKPEKILRGIKMGASLKRRHGGPLHISSWSCICKRSWYLQWLSASQVLSPTIPTTYHKQKHTSHNTYIAEYAARKNSLCGNASSETVKHFIDNAYLEANMSCESSSPMSAWLRTPWPIQNFSVEDVSRNPFFA